MSSTAERRDSEKPVARGAWASKSSSSEKMDTMENNSPTGEAVKGKKGKAVSGFFRKLCKAVKWPCACSGSDRVVRLSAKTDADLDCPGVVPGPSTVMDAWIPAPMCLPGQVFDETMLPLYVPSSTKTIKTTLDPEPPVPASSDLGHKKVKTGRKRKAVRAFFRRARKAVKRLFPCCDSENVQPPKAEPGLEQSQPALPEQDMVSVDLQSFTDEEALPEIQPLAEDQLSSVCRGASGSESSVSSEMTLDTELLDPEGSVKSFFEVGDMIASGNFSKVFELTHLIRDNVKVALKCIPKRREDRSLDIPGHPTPVLAEVAVMLRLGEAPSCPSIIQMHQWAEDESTFALIMEKPDPCMTLEDCILFWDPVSEAQARLFMLQVLQAVKHCHERGVYHGDIRSGNILVNLNSLELKLTDFRCARLISSEGFKSSEYQGSALYTPPEVLTQSVFHAAAADVWTMAVLLFEILHQHLPFKSFHAILHSCLRMRPTLSTVSHDLLSQCLSRSPAQRLTLEQLEEHRWMRV